MNRTVRAFAVCLGLVYVVAAPVARASATFPPALQRKLGLAEVPYPPLGCQLCHKTEVGGLMTVTRPFGRAMQKAGTAAANVPSMLSALGTLEASGTDSDGDGIGDIAELRATTDPNVAALGAGGAPLTAMEEIPLPETGCTLSGAPAPYAIWTALGTATALLLLRRRRV